jgi:hypothetical protein
MLKKSKTVENGHTEFMHTSDSVHKTCEDIINANGDIIHFEDFKTERPEVIENGISDGEISDCPDLEVIDRNDMEVEEIEQSDMSINETGEQ